MYKIEEIKDIHLEITSKCQAKCPMCPRRINGGPLNPLINITEIDLKTFKRWFSDEFIKQLNNLFMCGNLGDPIIAKDCLEIFKHLRKINQSMTLSMHTNGSARDKEWWQQLALLNVRVVFGIDGLEDTHSLYRISTDYNQILNNATSFIEAGGHAEWHMIVFQHNEHQIEDCKTISEKLGFKKFQIKHTTRFKQGKFNVLNDQGKTINVLYPSQKSLSMIEKTVRYRIDTNSNIDCKAKKYKQLYVSADGCISPCCWLDFSWVLPNQENRIDYMDKIGLVPNLNDNSIEDIFASGYFNKISETWKDQPLLECSKQCGNFDKSGEQFV